MSEIVWATVGRSPSEIGAGDRRGVARLFYERDRSDEGSAPERAAGARAAGVIPEVTVGTGAIRARVMV
jgi:hypothetical protein